VKKLIIDCDNTFGVFGCDLDDGLAIIYAAGTGCCELLGITTTFGNNTLEVVHPNTIEFMKRIGLADIPVYKGHETDPTKNEAARFLATAVATYPEEISVLSIGSLTNMYHASVLDANFFEQVGDLSLMGGVTEPLIICGKQLDELNFSCNSEASYEVLTKGKSIKIATGNNCLAALFTTERFGQLQTSDVPFLRWLHESGIYWFKRENEVFGNDGIYKWDVYAAAALLFPEMFDENIVEISPTPESMKTGMLLGGGTPKKVSLPQVKDSNAFMEHVYESYTAFSKRHSRI